MTPLRVDGPIGARVVVLSNALGTTAELWDAQLPALGDYRVVRYEHSARDSVAALASDLLGELGAEGIGRFSLCGVSLGGMVGLQLALDAPDRLERLVLVATTARFGEPEEWRAKAALVRERGMEAVADDALERWLTPRFANRDRFRTMQLDYDAEHYARGLEAIGGFDVRDRLSDVGAPTLVLVGSADEATPPEDARLIADGIPDAALEVVPDAAHLPNLEQPEVVNTAVLRHLQALD